MDYYSEKERTIDTATLMNSKSIILSKVSQTEKAIILWISIYVFCIMDVTFWERLSSVVARGWKCGQVIGYKRVQGNFLDQ
jgi:hypothetical protein